MPSIMDFFRTEEPDPSTMESQSQATDQTGTPSNDAGQGGDGSGGSEGGDGGQQPVVQQGVSMETVQALMDQQAANITQSLEQVMGRVLPQQVQTSQEPQMLESPSLDQIQAAYEEGDTAKALRLQSQREAAMEQRFDLRLNQLTNQGMQMFSDINRRTLLDGDPVYSEYKDEVDELLRQAGPAAANNPEMVKLCVDSVRGRHFDEIVQRQQEQAARAANLQTTQGPGSTQRTTNGQPREAPQQHIFIDSEGANALQEMGMTPDEYARDLGYNNWADMDTQYGEKLKHDVPRWQYTTGSVGAKTRRR